MLLEILLFTISLILSFIDKLSRHTYTECLLKLHLINLAVQIFCGVILIN